jgi:hypothetical protein
MKIKLTLDVFMHVPDEFSSDKIPVKVIDALFREQLAVGVFDPEEPFDFFNVEEITIVSSKQMPIDSPNI